MRLVVGARGGADPTNMWGPFDGPGWRENDPVVNAEKLRGTELYVSTGSGLPGPHDNLQAPDVNGNPGALLNQIIVGGIIESAVNGCTHGLADRLNALGHPRDLRLQADRNPLVGLLAGRPSQFVADDRRLDGSAVVGPECSPQKRRAHQRLSDVPR